MAPAVSYGHSSRLGRVFAAFSYVLSAQCCLLCSASSSAQSPPEGTDGYMPSTLPDGGSGGKQKSLPNVQPLECVGQAVLCTTGLRSALDAAISQTNSEMYVLDDLGQRYPTLPYMPILACPVMPSGDKNLSLWPLLKSLHRSDLLKQVLKRGFLRVASYGPMTRIPHPEGRHRAYHGYNWGPEGDYSVSPPQGFFPDLLRHLVDLISTHYKKILRIKWQFYMNGDMCLKSVQENESDITDIYFLQGVPPDPGSFPLIRTFYKTCPVAGSDNVFITQKAVNISSFEDIAATIRNNKGTHALSTIGYLTTANSSAIEHLLPPTVNCIFSTRDSALEAVRRGEILGIVVTGSLPEYETDLQVVHSNIIAAQGPWLLRTDNLECLTNRFELPGFEDSVSDPASDDDELTRKSPCPPGGDSQNRATTPLGAPTLIITFLLSLAISFATIIL